MLLFAISGFLNGFSALFFGTFIYLRNRKGRVYLLFYLSNLAVVLWAIPYGIWQLQTDKASAIFWCQILSIGTSLFPVLCLHLIITLLDKEREERKILYFGYFQTIIYLIFAFTPLIVAGVRPVGGFLWWPIPGIMYTFFMIFDYFGLLGYASYLLFKNYREAIGIKKEQIKYTALVLILPVLGAATNFPNWWGVYFPPYGNLFSFLYPFIMGYIISRYRLIDIRFIIGKSLVYVFSLLSVIGIDSIIIFANIKFNNLVNDRIIYVAISIISIFSYQILFKMYEAIAWKYFYYKIYSAQKIIADLWKNLASVLNLNKLISIMVATLSEKMGIDKVAIFLKNQKTKDCQMQKAIGFDSADIFAFPHDLFFKDYIEKNKSPLLYEEIVALKTVDENKRKTLEIMKRNEIALCVPILMEGDLKGLIVLGKKNSGDSYSTQDIDLLTTLSNQVSVALENARLYEEIDDLSKNLQQKVNEQTRELKESYLKEKKAREELEKLDETKNQFLLAVQHHLRTPLTTVKWTSESLLKQKPAKKIKDGLQQIKISTENLIKIVNEFLDITQFQMGKNVIKIEQGVNLKVLLENIINEVKFEAQSKKIKINFELKGQEFNNYEITADANKLKVAIFNIIDNAVKYTNRGNVNISLESDGKILKIIIKDTGIGILKEAMADLFSKAFERGKIARQTFATGRGIGLYISSQIIKAHKGKIWAESDGENKGSSFFVELPVYLPSP